MDLRVGWRGEIEFFRRVQRPKKRRIFGSLGDSLPDEIRFVDGAEPHLGHQNSSAPGFVGSERERVADLDQERTDGA
jgi:hypothetical protein